MAGGRDSSIQSEGSEALTAKLRLHSPLAKCFLAELLGTFLLVLIGDGAIAQVTLSKLNGNATGSFLSINFGYALALTIAVYASGGVSGGHVNPAVSLGMCTLGRLRWVALPVYCVAQLVGAFFGATVVYGVYLDAINEVEGGSNNRTSLTAGIFATYPEPYLTLQTGFVDQVVGTALLVGGISAAFDKYNTKPPSGLEPALVGALLMAIGLSFGYNAGYAINPARDFSPRLFTAMIGYGDEVWLTPSGDQFWWIPVLGPLVGGPLGAWIYHLAVGAHHDVNKRLDSEDGNRPLLAGSE
ncbi:aquaporin-9-like [Diadema antillarum]|uniref:aquaporin-9-like n=1 Tax=Diadema antillarum TaxID=105358 RepID=UPI003A8BE2BC